jgi:hypothetical protein
MQSNFMNHHQLSQSKLLRLEKAEPASTLTELSKQQNLPVTPESPKELKPFLFETYFAGCMDMYSDADTVADYLDDHENWFCRCAQPMKVEVLGNNGYSLTVGNFGSFGYEVEPKIAVVLNPPVDRVYTMHTIPLPDYESVGYEVNYQAVMELREVAAEVVVSASEISQSITSYLPSKITQVTWKLDLAVKVIFPKFIHKLPSSLIQGTGDRLLGQIVRQISPRLTYKVQQDFHNRFSLPLPPKSGRRLEKVNKSEYSAA